MSKKTDWTSEPWFTGSIVFVVFAPPGDGWKVVPLSSRSRAGASPAMSAVENLLEQAGRLSARERRRLVDRLEHSLLREVAGIRRTSARRPYARSLALAGTVHTNFSDVSSNKYRHVGEAVARRYGR
jgi:hypothetical protein